MEKLIPIMIFAILMSVCIQKNDRHELRKKGKVVGSGNLFVFILIVGLGVFTGLRTWYNDTVTYIGVYNNLTPTIPELFANFDLSFTDAIGFTIINSILKTIGATSQDFIMFYGIANMAIYMLALRKISNSLPFSMFLFFCVGCFTFAQAGIKQSMAMAIGCWAFDYASERKWIKFTIATIIAALFHPYAIIYFIMPLMTFRPWTINGYFWIAVFICVGFGLKDILNTILNFTEALGASYTTESFSGEGVNIFRLLVCLVPTLLSFVFQNVLYKDAGKREYLMMNLAMVNGLIMFVALFGTANYFARLANFFLPMQIVAIPWIISRLNYSNRRILTYLCVTCYCLFFYYQSGYSQAFDNQFQQISLWEYLGGKFIG